MKEDSVLPLGYYPGVGVVQSTQEVTEGFESLRRTKEIRGDEGIGKKRK